MSRLIADEASLISLEEKAMKEAVAEVVPSVVQIETFGGLERVGRFLVGTGPTTGLVVSSDGYVVSSAFNFVQQPSSILIRFSDGRRSAAQIVARDHSRMLVLLKVNDVDQLPTTEPVPREEMNVGQWAIAVGQTFADGANRSVGIISATDRIWGKAIQTDAKVSPNNYGGPLVDIRGRVLGVLVPLSPHGSGDISGAEWYDSGIGFAVPLVDILARLEQWKTGRDLHSGIIGISLEGNDMHVLPATIAACMPNSPARAAGLKVGDVIVQVNDDVVARQVQLKHALGAHYAGDEVRIVVMRGEERMEVACELADAIDPYEHPFLGILPDRHQQQVIVVRYVYPGSSAERAGLKAEDQLLTIAGLQVSDVPSAWKILAALESRENVEVVFQRQDQDLAATLNLDTLSPVIPVGLPKPVPLKPPENGDPSSHGVIEVKVPEAPNECFAYVPENYRVEHPYGLVIWLHIPGEYDRDQIVRRWKQVCEEYGMIVLAPQANDAKLWRSTEIEFIRNAVEQIIDKYSVDRNRVVAYGHKAGGTLAYLLAFRHMELVRGVAVVDAPLPSLLRAPATDPLQRLSIYISMNDDPTLERPIRDGVQRLQQLKYPVFLDVRRGDVPGIEVPHQLIQWMDTLDRI